MAAPLLLAALAACGGDGPTESTPSSIRFSYSGSGPEGNIQGLYEAEGDPALAVPPITQTYALGRRVSDENTIEVRSNLAQPAEQTADFAWVTIPRLTEGSVTIDGICPGELCPEVTVALEVSTSIAVSQAKYSCALENGIIRITEISNSRAKGTFSGTGSCVGRPGTADLELFTVTGGTFDVKVLDLPG